MFSLVVENLFILVEIHILVVDNFFCGERWGK